MKEPTYQEVLQEMKKRYVKELKKEEIIKIFEPFRQTILNFEEMKMDQLVHPLWSMDWEDYVKVQQGERGIFELSWLQKHNVTPTHILNMVEETKQKIIEICYFPLMDFYHQYMQLLIEKIKDDVLDKISDEAGVWEPLYVVLLEQKNYFQDKHIFEIFHIPSYDSLMLSLFNFNIVYQYSERRVLPDKAMEEAEDQYQKTILSFLKKIEKNHDLDSTQISFCIQYLEKKRK